MPKEFKPAQGFSDQPRPPIVLVPVTSNQVKAIGYDAETQTLAVAFTRGTGAIYHYPNVNAEMHSAFMQAESVGKYFGAHIKNLPFEKFVAEPEAEEGPQSAVAAAAGGLTQTAVEF